MHQTFYIDIDEEITSVVERLKKARASEIIMVVPKRALLIQSIINLRLLKKEAEGMGLQLMIVTQDKLGKLLIEKAGILVQQKLEETDDEIIDIRNDGPSHATEESHQDFPGDKGGPDTGRLSKLGSDSFFQSAQAKDKPMEKLSVALANDVGTEKITNKELVSEIGKDIRKDIRKSPSLSASAKRMDMGISSNQKNMASDLGKPDSFSWGPEAGQVGRYFGGENRNSSFDQDKKIENFFHPENNVHPEKVKLERPWKKRDFSQLKRFFLAVAVLAILLGIGAAAYMFIPKADIALAVKQKIKEQDYTLKGDASKSGVDLENEIVPVKIIEVTSEVTKEYATSGKKSASSSQKAKGTITIYNEFSNTPQPLVATTRFLSDSGKLFRLVSAVTVPGTSKVGEETKPGVIEAEVVADQPGEEYNIEPTKFSIPGFKDNGNEKYNKIYAKSTKAMSGGGNSASASTDEARAITADDIAKAKSDIIIDLGKNAKEKIAASSQGMILLDDAINNEEATYKTSNAVGEMAQKFQVTAQSRSQAIVFSEKDLKELISGLLAKSAGGLKTDSSNISLEYGKSLPDFKNKTLDIKIHVVAKTGTGIDVEKFKSEIVGKDNEEFESYLSNYPDIARAEVTYWPPFISRIPKFSQRIGVTLDISE